MPQRLTLLPVSTANHRVKEWQPEDGRCRECGDPLETENEQLTGACSFCDLEAEEDYQAEQEDGGDPIADFYNDNGYF